MKKKKPFIMKTVRHRRKKIRTDTRTWYGFPCSWPERINIMKVTILPKVTCKFNAITIKISRTIFTDSENRILKFIGKQNTKESQSNTDIGGITIPEFKLIQRATVIKTEWYWHKYRHINQWSRIEDPR